MKWTIILFETVRREKPVEEFIKSLTESTMAKVAHKMSKLRYIGYTSEVEYLPKKEDKTDVQRKVEELLFPPKPDKHSR